MSKSSDNNFTKRVAAKWLLAKGKYDHIDFKPPESVANAAVRGLEYRKKGGGGGLSTEQASKQGIGSGVQRATNLKNRTNLSPSTVRRMHSFFSRHEKNKAIDAKHKGTPWKDRGYVAWLLWGGDPGAAWARKVVRQMDAADEKAKKASHVAKDDHPAERDGTYMSRRFIRQMSVQSSILSKMLKEGMPLMDWQEAKLAMAAKDFNAVFNSLMYGEESPFLRMASDNEPTKPELWSRAKAEAKKRFEKYPSAYANGWAVQWYNEKGGGWRKKTKKDD